MTDKLTHRRKPELVYAFQWDGQPVDQLPKWLQLKANVVDNNRHLWINSAMGSVVRRGDWIVSYQDGLIEAYSVSEFAEQFEEAVQ